MAVGLYLDLAVSVDRAGADTWRTRRATPSRPASARRPTTSIRNGQDWGLPPLRPDRLRAEPLPPLHRGPARQHAPRRRAAHRPRDGPDAAVLGAARQARRATAPMSHYPFDELLAIVALESQRHRCLVIGEDLGTVPDEMREALRRPRRAVVPAALFRARPRRRLPGAARLSARCAGGRQHPRPADAGRLVDRPGHRAAPRPRPARRPGELRPRSRASATTTARRLLHALRAEGLAAGIARRRRRREAPMTAALAERSTPISPRRRRA